MPPPYPKWFLQGNAVAAGSRGYVHMCRQKAVNLVVLMLNWLHLNRPDHAAEVPPLHSVLTRRQWSVVRRLERQLSDLEKGGAVGPEQMGRTAAKMESLDSAMEKLHEDARQLLPEAYRKPGFAALGEQYSFFNKRSATAAGVVVGKVKLGNMMMAKEVESERLSVPLEPPEFRPEELFTGLHREVFVDPMLHARNPELALVTPPRVQLHASRKQAFELLHFLDRCQRLTLAPAGKVREGFCCGAFCLVKDQHKDRLILDARPPNSLEDPLAEWVKTLGSISALVQLELAPGHNLYMSGTDLVDYYYCYKVSQQRSFRNALAFPLTAHQAAAFSCFKITQDTADKYYPCLSTLAMGDNQAVELGQCAHVQMGLISGAFQASQLLTVHGRAPRGNVACGVVIDDVLICEQLPEAAAEEYTEGEARLDKLCEEYLQRGVKPHPRKTFRKVPVTECWGASIDGISGLVRAAPKRLIPVMWITSRIALLGFASVGLLQVIAGSWISILQVRRRMLCLLDYVYLAQQGREQDDLVRLSPELISELWSLVALGPVAVADLRAETHPEIFLSDASEEFTASVKTKATQVFCRELQRHCLARGVWSKLLSPWKSWLRSKEQLAAEDELPEGVPLVSHPLWLEIAETMPFQHHHKKQVRSRKHINILELQSILEAEAKVAEKKPSCRYVLASDSQVALAVITKGRSSSPSLNTLLRRSLATVLGFGVYGYYGYVPSLANCADDPTRFVELRKPTRKSAFDLDACMVGDFRSLDLWLEGLGFSVDQVTDLPVAEQKKLEVEQLQRGLLAPLRRVQKPERLAKFDASCSKDVSPPVKCLEETTREQEPEGQTKFEQKRPEEHPERQQKSRPIKAVSSASDPVAPPDRVPGSQVQLGSTGPTRAPRRRRKRCSHGTAENQQLPELAAAVSAELSLFPAAQFLLPGGGRSKDVFSPKRQGFLDLYSGKAGVAKKLCKKYKTWVLTFDFCHGDNQNLLDEKLQTKLLKLMHAGAFWGVGAAPECSSFSRAVSPPVRDRLHPEGLPDISQHMQKKVFQGNQHGKFVLLVLQAAITCSMCYWVENPDGSFLWLQPNWLKSGLATFQQSYRFDMCRHGTPWRKRTRICTNTCLRGVRQLCAGGHSHRQLRGRSAAHGMCWTKVAQEYPGRLCAILAHSLASFAGLSGIPRRFRLDIAACAHCEASRIGEASNPGPPKTAARQRRNVSDLLDAPMLDAGTLIIQDRTYSKFLQWLHGKVSPETAEQVFLCPSLGAEILRVYGLECYQAGEPLYELRHLLVFLQHQHPLLKPVLGPAWDIISRWEEVKPVQHRTPLPEILFRAMFSVAMFLGWRRWAATLLLGYEGIARIGEVLAAIRRDLVLPADMFEGEQDSLFLKIRKPKSKRRGKGRVQHLKVQNPAAVAFLDRIFGPLDSFLALYPHSAAHFRTRWEKILNCLRVPKSLRPTPASIRGGGAILAYRRGEGIPSILWRMRLVSQVTLESYLQELAADSFLVDLPEATKHRIRFSSEFFTVALASPG
eukprot:Skav223762  [mRNA]  locus=scaffold521:2192:6754:+ [translate_table: standard]